jgi:hypothetical protein
MLKTINLVNKKVLELIEKRAAGENRTPTNAANTTIIEALSERYGKQDTTYTENHQEKTQ